MKETTTGCWLTQRGLLLVFATGTFAALWLDGASWPKLSSRYKVTLTTDERQQLKELIGKGKGAARKLTHARILLLANESEDRNARTDAEIAEVLHVGLRPCL